MAKKRSQTPHTTHVFLKEWRKLHGLTLEALAEQTGKSVSTLSGWERGERQVDLADLTHLANFYGVHPSALLLHPQDANPTLEAMRAASEIARTMEADAVADWLAVGRKLPKADKDD